MARTKAFQFVNACELKEGDVIYEIEDRRPAYKILEIISNDSTEVRVLIMKLPPVEFATLEFDTQCYVKR